MANKFEEYYADVDERESDFLLAFMFQLTILGRSILLDSDDVDRCVSGLKQLNELNHRILNRLLDIDSKNPWSSKEYVINKVSHHVGLAPHIASGVLYAAKEARSKLAV